MYRVVKYFTDLQDNGYAYNVGDKFPRDGMAVSNDRINQLISNANKQRTQLIKFVDEEEEDISISTPAPDDSPVAVEAQETFDEDSLSDMTTKEIVALAERRGYKITKIKKADVIDQFLTQQK